MCTIVAPFLTPLAISPKDGARSIEKKLFLTSMLLKLLHRLREEIKKKRPPFGKKYLPLRQKFDVLSVHRIHQIWLPVIFLFPNLQKCLGGKRPFQILGKVC